MSFAVPFPLHGIASSRSNARLILFLHGLDGHWKNSWGQPGMPGSFMQRVAARFADTVVLSVDYPASVSDFVSAAQTTVAAVAEAWADQLAGALLGRYQSIAFVTHCLGGLVTLQALRLLSERLPETQKTLHHGDGVSSPRLFCLLMDAPLRWPSQVLPQHILQLALAIGINQTELEANLAFLSKSMETGTLRCAAVASSVQNWLSAFEPLAGAQPATRWQLPVRHEELSRAPATGSFAPLSIAEQCLADFFGGTHLDVTSRTNQATGPA